MKIYKFIHPTEDARFRLFDDQLEDNPLVFFHTTPVANVESIIESGFRFGHELKSISYAKNSSSCLAHRGQNVDSDHAVFVVEFESIGVSGIKINSSDIHVFLEDVQPMIRGYCLVPKEYDYR